MGIDSSRARVFVDSTWGSAAKAYSMVRRFGLREDLGVRVLG